MFGGSPGMGISMTPIGHAATQRCAGWSITGSAASARPIGRFETKSLNQSTLPLSPIAQPVNRQDSLRDHPG
jgi:hypothetical protein